MNVFCKTSARVCRLGDGITVSAYLAMTCLAMTYLAWEGTSAKQVQPQVPLAAMVNECDEKV